MASWPDATLDAGHGAERVVTKNEPHAATIKPNAAMVKARAATGPIAERAATRPTSNATRTTARMKLAEFDGVAAAGWLQSIVDDGNWPAR